MIGLRILPMNSKDIGEAYKIEQLSYRTPWSKAMFMMDYLLNNNSRYYSAKRMGRVVGFIAVWNEKERLHIVNIAVHPDYRRKGIGKRLIEFAIQLAKREGKKEIYLEVRVSNIAAQMLYKQAGFEVYRKKPNYYDDGEDGLVMKKVINENFRD